MPNFFHCISMLLTENNIFIFAAQVVIIIMKNNHKMANTQLKGWVTLKTQNIKEYVILLIMSDRRTSLSLIQTWQWSDAK